MLCHIGGTLAGALGLHKDLAIPAPGHRLFGGPGHLVDDVLLVLGLFEQLARGGPRHIVLGVELLDKGTAGLSLGVMPGIGGECVRQA